MKTTLQNWRRKN